MIRFVNGAKIWAVYIKKTALIFFRKLLKSQGELPFELIKDKLKSYGAAKNEIMSSVTHTQERYANNGAENSHQRTRQKERQKLSPVS